MTTQPNRRTVAADDVRRFATLFAGRTDAYGSVEGKAHKVPVTLDTYRRHLEGELQVGIYPIRDDDSIDFGALDFDHKEGGGDEANFTLARNEAVGVMGMLADWGVTQGMYFERSKGKGAHIWTLVDEPVPATWLRRLLGWAFRTVYPDRPLPEIFPKQDTTANVKYGNYINLPYPGSGDGVHRSIYRPGAHEPMPFEEFLATVKRLPKLALEVMVDNLPDGMPDAKGKTVLRSLPGPAPRPQVTGSGPAPAGGPAPIIGKSYPCTTLMLTAGLAEGAGRNQMAFLLSKRMHVAGLADERGWRIYQGWNLLNTPPLVPSELETCWKQGAKFTSMECDNPIVGPFCLTSCPIHPSRTGNLTYRWLRKENTEPVAFILTVGSADIRLKKTEIHNHHAIMVEALAQADLNLPAMKPKDWQHQLDGLIAEMEVIAVPDSAKPAGILWEYIASFLAQRVELDDPAADPETRPVAKNDRLWFKRSGLDSWLGLKLKKEPSREELWSVFSLHGGEARTARVLSGHKADHYWSLPADSLAPEPEDR